METAQAKESYNLELDKTWNKKYTLQDEMHLLWNNGYDAAMRRVLSHITGSRAKTIKELIEIIEGELNEEF